MEQEKKCNTCKKGLNNTQIGLTILSLVILGTSIYGFVEIIKNLISIFF
jgi:hypothetical protein